ncbi:MAG: hypothetical protein EBR73_01445 [Rhodobacteraceae bacterium]|nr:hypothetical protein [Paracoccaceae bacterium]
MEISILETTDIETNNKGYQVQFIARTGKKQTNESDFFPNGSEIETTIQQLKKLLRKYFDANP